MPGIHVLARCPAGPVTAADLVGQSSQDGELGLWGERKHLWEAC